MFFKCMSSFYAIKVAFCLKERKLDINKKKIKSKNKEEIQLKKKMT